MHHLPPTGHPAREMFEVSHLVETRLGNRFLTLQEAKSRGRKYLATGGLALKRVLYFVRLANDDEVLVSIGKRGAHRVEWNFSKGDAK